MDFCFHYQCIRVLAASAGLSAAQSDILAYASQYTDHATEHKPIRVAHLPPEASPQTVRDSFEPVCTAHEALQYVTQWKSRDAQLKVYIAFHFIPPEPFFANQPFEFLVEPESTLPRQLVRDAVAAVAASAASSTEHLRSLIRAGIALHSFADTWAHQGFSGRFSPCDNAVRDRKIWDNGAWHDVPLLTRIALDMAPDVGHAELAVMPDQSDLRFRYRRSSNGTEVERDNPTEFLKAAKAIYELLCECTGESPNWNNLSPSIESCFRDPSQWTKLFANIFSTGGYDRLAWRRAALLGDRHDWDRMSDASDFAELDYTAGDDLKWFLFHVEAGKQRDFVLRQIEGAKL